MEPAENVTQPLRRLIVQKYGGTSVGSLEHIRNAARNICAKYQEGYNLVVVASAMGAYTDDLLTMAGQLHSAPPKRELDMLLTAGERISVALLSIALNDLGIPSVSFTGSQSGILTDETHGNARIHSMTPGRIKAGLADGKVVLVAGFQGVSPVTKEITTLGRGGSDLSAIALAASLEAIRCELYKDVRGIFSADPRVLPSAKLISKLSWELAENIAWSGGGVLHSRAAHLARKFSVPVWIRSSLEPHMEGTSIMAPTLEDPQVYSLVHKKHLCLLQLESARNGLLAAAASWFWKHTDAPLLLRQVEVEGREVVSALVPVKHADLLAAELEHAFDFSVKITSRVDDLAAITVLGSGFPASPELLSRMVASLTNYPILTDSGSAKIMFVVKDKDIEHSLKSLHQCALEDGYLK